MGPTPSTTRLKMLWPAALLALLVLMPPSLASMAGEGGEADSPTTLALARVEVPGMINDLPVPVHADLVDGDGVYYALTIVPRDQLQRSGVVATILDEAPPGTTYLLAVGREPEKRQAAGKLTTIRYDDGRRIVVRDAPGLTADLSRLGLFPRPLRSVPIEFAPAPAPLSGRSSATIVKSPQIQAMLDKVTTRVFSNGVSELSGETAITVGGKSYTITTRHTASGTPIEKATQYVHERLQALGLSASYHDWTSGAYSGRNVIGERRGSVVPNEIIIMVAHLDSINEKAEQPTDPAPGADDDGSGCSALLAAAAIMKDYRFERTIRFVFTTGEENGLLGSAVYAKKLKDAGERVLDVVNLDMIAYSTQTSPVQNLHTRLPANPGYAGDMNIANLFVNVVNTYGLSQSLAPLIVSDNNDEGDHYSFWEHSFPSIMAIEDHNNFNPNYHCKLGMDKLEYLNLAYGAANTKAAIGTVAHLAVPRKPTVTSPSMLLLESR